MAIQYWNRLEPITRDRKLDKAMSAKLRDPLWMLTRQWQMGEFTAKDSGSPAYVEISIKKASMTQAANEPIEKNTMKEAFTADLALRVELGQVFTEILRQKRATEAVFVAFKDNFSFGAVAAPATLISTEEIAFRTVCDENTLDGFEVYKIPAATNLATALGLGATDAMLASEALHELQNWVAEVYSEIAEMGEASDPENWEKSKLRYELEQQLTSSGAPSLLTYPDRNGSVNWHSFDFSAATTTLFSTTEPTKKIIPTQLRFKGMPNSRWWDFESATMNLDAMHFEKVDMVKLLLMEFVFLYSNNWFIVPYDQTLGTAVSVASLVVHDVFGGSTNVLATDRRVNNDGSYWTMFTNTVEGGMEDAGARLDNCLVLPSGGGETIQTSAPLEETHFFRDEAANIAWAIEKQAADSLGLTRPGHERDQINAEAQRRTAGDQRNAQNGLFRYDLQTQTPIHWVPFAPVPIWRGTTPTRQIALAETELVVPGGRASSPVGRILNPELAINALNSIREEEIPRTGASIARVICRSRWTDGSTHIWVQRRRGAASGEGASGIAFDSVK